jgi:hypothetical protein
MIKVDDLILVRRKEKAEYPIDLSDNQIRALLYLYEKKKPIILNNCHYRTRDSLEEIGMIEIVREKGYKLTEYGRDYLLKFEDGMKYDLISQREEGDGWGTYYYPYNYNELNELVHLGIMYKYNQAKKGDNKMKATTETQNISVFVFDSKTKHFYKYKAKNDNQIIPIGILYVKTEAFKNPPTEIQFDIKK